MQDLPNINKEEIKTVDNERIHHPKTSSHPPKTLLLYDSLRETSYSRPLIEEAQRILEVLGDNCKIFNSSGLPLSNDVPESHAKLRVLRR